MLTLLAIVSLAVPPGDHDYFLSVPSLGSVFRVDATTKQSTLVASGLGIPFYGFFDAAGNLYLPDRLYGAIFKIAPSGQLTPLSVGGLLTTPVTTVPDPNGNGMIVSDLLSDRLVRVGFDGSQSIFLDDAAAGGLLEGPGGLAFDGDGNLYIANNLGNSILKVDPAHHVTVFSNSPLISAPGGMVCDGSGNLFCAMYSYATIVRFRLDDASAEDFAFDLSIMSHPNDLRLSRTGGLLATSRQSNLIRIDALGNLSVEFQDTNFGEIDGIAVPIDSTPCSGTFKSYGSGIPGSLGLTPKLRALFSPCPGLPIALELRDFIGSSPAWLVLGVNPTNLPLLGGALLVDPSALFVVVPFTMPGNGKLVLPFDTVADPAFVGVKLYFQALASDPAAVHGISFSNGLVETIGN